MFRWKMLFHSRCIYTCEFVRHFIFSTQRINEQWPSTIWPNDYYVMFVISGGRCWTFLRMEQCKKERKRTWRNVNLKGVVLAKQKFSSNFVECLCGFVQWRGVENAPFMAGKHSAKHVRLCYMTICGKTAKAITPSLWISNLPTEVRNKFHCRTSSTESRNFNASVGNHRSVRDVHRTHGRKDSIVLI